ALALARHGARVVVNDLGDQASDVVRDIHEQGGEAQVSCGSVVTEAFEMVQVALERWGRLDAVVNNAGVLRDRSFGKMTDREWFDVIDVHLTGTRNVIRAALPALRAHGGAIINTTSLSGLLGRNFGQTNYSAAKAAVYGLTLTLSVELARYGVRCNCIAPVARTSMTQALPEDRVPTSWSPDFVAPVVVWLASDLAAHVTGKVIGVAGPRVFAYEMRVGEGIISDESVPFTPLELAERAAQVLSVKTPESSPR
ncbi:MAG: NAD(P)-dependent dehydrogenase (short-subunit alcohol dehydrogenase family), partial [Kiritimatiellia bacterium]